MEMEQSVAILEQIAREAESRQLSFAEKAGLAASARAVGADLAEMLDRELPGKAVGLKGKVSTVVYGIAASLGQMAPGAGDPRSVLILANQKLQTLKAEISELS